eukprot:5919165-Pleurochrysis_carterae.AAC.1
MTVVHYALIGTLIVQTELQRRDSNGPYVPLSEYAKLTFLRLRPPPTDVSDDDGGGSSTSRAESIDPTNPVATAVMQEMNRMTGAGVSGRPIDLERMQALL